MSDQTLSNVDMSAEEDLQAALQGWTTLADEETDKAHDEPPPGSQAHVPGCQEEARTPPNARRQSTPLPTTPQGFDDLRRDEEQASQANPGKTEVGLAEAKQKTGKKPNISLLPRRAFCSSTWKDREAYDLAKQAYQDEWASRPEVTKSRPLSHAQKIRLMFFGHTSKKEGVPDPKPRCRLCRIGGNVMPPADVAPDGTEARPLVPCGCDYAAACLEWYYDMLGLSEIAAAKGKQLGATKKLVPKTSGASAFEMLLRWELDHGEPWTMKTMISASGERVEAVKRTAALRQENNWLLCPDFEPPAKPQTPRKNKRAVEDIEANNGGFSAKRSRKDGNGGGGGGGNDGNAMQ